MKAIVKITYQDKYTGILHEVGEEVEETEDRIAELAKYVEAEKVVKTTAKRSKK